jgi:uncharacterized protein (DUF2062 family)
MIAEFKEIWDDMTKKQRLTFCSLLAGAVISAAAIVVLIAKANSMPIPVFAKAVPLGILLGLVFTITLYCTFRMLWGHQPNR